MLTIVTGHRRFKLVSEIPRNLILLRYFAKYLNSQMRHTFVHINSYDLSTKSLPRVDSE